MEDRRRMGGRESKMEIVEKKLVKAETDGQFDSGRKRKKDRK